MIFNSCAVLAKEQIDKLIQEYEYYAKEHGLMLNPDREVVKRILRAIIMREKKFSCRYCPCRVVTGDKEKDAKIICPCAHILEEVETKGQCLCRLFVKKV
jgi:ferredoxin-thioredoxin reductase catalytic subunit